MSAERQRLRPWLERMINSADIPGLCWIDKENTKFRVTWKHAGKPDFDIERDAVLFRKWAEHTGKYKPGEQPDPSTWKTRFRCALHKMPDIEEVRIPHSLDEREPYRVFRLKPKVPNSKGTSVPSSMSTPSPSPPMENNSGISAINSQIPPFPYGGFISRPPPPYGTIPYSQDNFPFPSPMSSHTSNSPNSADINNNLFPDDDLDNITPTLPPSLMPTGQFDDPMDDEELKDTHPIPCALSDVYLMRSDYNKGYSNANSSLCYPMANGFGHSEPTFTELQSVKLGDNLGSNGSAVYDGLPYIGAGPKMANPAAFMFQNGFQAGLLRMLHAGMSMEVPDMPPVNSGYTEHTPMNFPVPNESPTGMAEVPSSTQSLGSPNSVVELTELSKLVSAKELMDVSDCSMFVRVYYDETEVADFRLDKEDRTWRMYYGKPVKPDENNLGLYSQLYGPLNAKHIELPERRCSKETQLVLANFNRGLVLEMIEDGDIYVKRMCLSKVFYSNGFRQPYKLSREVSTKVFDFKGGFQQKLRESQRGNCAPPSYDITLSLGQSTGGLVCISITHLPAKVALQEKQKGEECVSEPNKNDKLASDLESRYSQ